MARQTKRPILMVSVTPFKGGGETHDAKLAQLLAERYELQAVVSNPWLKDQMVNLGIPVTRIRSTGLMGRYALFALVFLKHCLLSRPAAAHLNGQGEAYFSPLFKLFGIKTVIARHTPLNIVNNWIKRIVVSVCYRLADKVICVSSVVRRDMENIIHHDRIITISNWLMDEEFSCPRQFRATSEPFRLLFVGRLVEFKGAHDLIDAMKHLDACSLEIVGDGPEREELTNRARDLPVRFEGVVDDCIPFYDRADLLVFPSYPLEGQGQT